MPIRIPDTLPAKQVLESERVFVMGEKRAMTQDIRTLRILILNLMPNKVTTETQLLRALSNSPLQVVVELMMVKTHTAKNTSADHLSSFYVTFDQVRDKRYDGLIITGAPVEQMPFEEVDYWDELVRIMDWSLTNVTSTLHICWGAQAALYHHHGIAKHALPEKMFGVFRHKALDHRVPLMRGFDDVFCAPHSRHTGTLRQDIEACPALSLLAYSDIAGPYMAMTENGRQIFVMGHSEYDRDTLKDEYLRDKEKGLPIRLPYNYFPDDDPTRTPVKSWRAHCHLLFTNWLNYYVYQQTPYDL